MAGKQELYAQSMDAGHDAAWNHDWIGAIRNYSNAVQQIPEDGEAHIHLGLSLLRAGRLEDALKVYKRAHQLLPDEPTPLEKSADVLERLGRLKEAAQQYISVADIYLTLRDLDKAIGNWERATQLTPGLIAIHARLAQAYERVGDKRRALREYLTLAFNFQRSGDTEKAIKSVERALRLDRRNPQALNTLRALRSGGLVVVPEFDDEEKENQTMLESFGVSVRPEEEDDPTDDLGPIGESMRHGLVMLADFITSSGRLDAGSASAMQGMELQRQGDYKQAIKAYQNALGAIDHPSLRFNLGAMLYMEKQPEEAVKFLSKSMEIPALAAGALHGLGLAALDIGKAKQAVRYLLQSLQAVDNSLTMSDQERSELATLYNRLLGAVDGSPDDMLRAMADRFADLLHGKDWKSRIPITRKHVAEILDTQGDQGVRDFFSTGGSDKLAQMVARIDSYIGQGLLTLAMDEAHEAMTTSPNYLPIHVRMAEVMMREGRLRQAIQKYDVVARSYMARAEYDRAASILGEVLEIAPLDINIRQSLINLLESEDRMDEVLIQMVELGRTFNQLNNFESGREVFMQAERLARRIDAPPVRMVEIKHALADMEQVRLDVRRAMKLYEEIVDLQPDDERAYHALIDLSFSQGNHIDAMKYLDRLLKVYAQRKQISKITKQLEDMIKIYPKEPGLRSRLAAIYRQTGRKHDAINQLDELGRMQVSAGMRHEARNTVKQLMALNPENAAVYKKLLAQLS